MKKIDFHSHVLPGVDHGSDSVKTSLFQIKNAIKAKMDIVVATPHFYPHRHKVDDFIRQRDRGYNSLIGALADDMKGIRILKGAEILIFDGLDRLPGIDKLCIEGTSVLLLELPFSDFHSDFPDLTERLISLGFKVVLAHAERYSQINVERMIEAGAKLQLNASALSGIFPNRACIKWIMRDLVVGIGSDIHNMDASAYKKFLSAEKKYSKEFEAIMENSCNILDIN